MHMKSADNGETYHAEQGDTVIYGGMQLHFKYGKVRIEVAGHRPDEKKLRATPTTGAGGGLVLEVI